MRAPHKLAVFRATQLGDMLCATPALRALRRGYPRAHITLIGLPWAQHWAPRLRTVDAFEAFPGWPGLPESPPPTPEVTEVFLERQRAREYDLVVQLHGSGQHSNAIVAAFGAAHAAGFVSDGAWLPAQDADRFVPWPEDGSEVQRLLTLTDRLGLPRQGDALDCPVDPMDRMAVADLQPTLPYALLHPGAQWPSRRWPVERFAAVGDALAELGVSVLVTGVTAEAPLAQRVVRAMHHPATNLAGQTSLGVLAALVERAAIVVCNDTGVSHVAAALRTPSVVVASGSDVSRWAPADTERHRVLWQLQPCRPCTHRDCPVTHPQPHPCAKAVDTGTVITTVRDQLRRWRGIV